MAYYRGVQSPKPKVIFLFPLEALDEVDLERLAGEDVFDRGEGEAAALALKFEFGKELLAFDGDEVMDFDIHVLHCHVIDGQFPLTENPSLCASG